MDILQKLTLALTVRKKKILGYYLSTGVGQLCVDWRGHNIYWTDSVYGWIAMQKLPPNILTHNSLQTSFKLVVERYLHTPTGIVVHPLKQ